MPLPPKKDRALLCGLNLSSCRIEEIKFCRVLKYLGIKETHTKIAKFRYCYIALILWNVRPPLMIRDANNRG